MDNILASPLDYLETYYSKTYDPENIFLRRVLRNFVRFDGLARGSFLDYGCGPTIFSVIPCTSKASYFHMADASLRCLHEIEKWIRKAPEGFDWIEWFYAYEAELNIKVKRQHVQTLISRLIQSNIITLNKHDFDLPYDNLISLFAIETAAANNDHYQHLIQQILEFVSPKGKFIIGVMLNSQKYQIERNFVSNKTVITQEFFEKIFEKYPKKKFEYVASSEPRGYSHLAFCYGRNIE